MSKLSVFSLLGGLCLLVSATLASGAASSASSPAGQGGTSASPVLSNFAVSPALVAPGQFVNFSWASANAKSFQVTPEIVQDDQTLPVSTSAYSYNTNGLAKTTTFQATAASGVNGTARMAVTLAVVPVRLSASTVAVHGGQSVTLSYSGPNNNSTWELHSSSSDIAIPLPHGCSGTTCSGSYQTPPLAASTTFSVSLTGPAPTGGQAYSPRVMVKVAQPTTLSFKAQAQNAGAPGEVTLSWATKNAAGVTIDGVGALTPIGAGSYCCVHPTKTTTYTATATPIYPGASPVVATSTVTVSTGDITNLNHIIIMVQENRSFDNYFGQLAAYRVNHQPPIQGAQLSDVNDLHTLPEDFKICNPNNLCYPLFHARTECTENLSPAWDESHFSMDLVGFDWLNVNQNSQFLMDNFLKVNWSNGQGGVYDTQHTRPLGYYDQTDLPFYYELATQFTVDDAFYSPVATNTVPNRMYLFSGTSYGHAFAPTKQTDPAWQRPTIFRALQNAGIKWRYYYQDNSVFLSQWADWNDPNISGNVRSIQELYTYLSSPNADQLLPQVVFIERASQLETDEHPLNNIQTGAASVQNILNYLFNSAAWPSSAFILTYDEAGGLHDHAPPLIVTPPDSLTTPTDLQPGDINAMFNTTGLRVPNIVISPWSRPQTVIHLATDYTSMLKLIEKRFNLAPLTQRDATVPDMDDPVNGFFDFSSPHLLVVPPLPVQPTTGTCDRRFSGYKDVKIVGQ